MENSINKNKDVDTQKDTPEKREFEIRRRAYNNLRGYVSQIYEASALGQTNKKNSFVNMVKDNIGLIIGEKYNAEVEIEVENAFKNLEDGNKEELINTGTEITINIIAKYLSLSELEKRLLERHLTIHGFRELSRGLTYDIIPNNETIELHIPVTFFENPEIAIESYKKGLAILARKLLEDPELKNVKEIYGRSILVKKKQLIIEQLGFNVEQEEVNGVLKPTGYASISREKLIELYGEYEKEK